jgi:hypothetical protein
MNLLARGFDNKTQLNNRGLIGATIDETILEVVKNLRIADVTSSAKVPLCDCEERTFYEWEKDENICSECNKPLYRQTGL